MNADSSIDVIALQFEKASQSISKTEKEFENVHPNPRSLWGSVLILVFKLLLSDTVQINDFGAWINSVTNSKDISKEHVWPRLLECLKLKDVQTVLLQNNFQDVVSWANEDPKAMVFQSIINKLQFVFPTKPTSILRDLSTQTKSVWATQFSSILDLIFNYKPTIAIPPKQNLTMEQKQNLRRDKLLFHQRWPSSITNDVKEIFAGFTLLNFPLREKLFVLPVSSEKNQGMCFFLLFLFFLLLTQPMFFF